MINYENCFGDLIQKIESINIGCRDFIMHNEGLLKGATCDYVMELIESQKQAFARDVQYDPEQLLLVLNIQNCLNYYFATEQE